MVVPEGFVPYCDPINFVTDNFFEITPHNLYHGIKYQGVRLGLQTMYRKSNGGSVCQGEDWSLP